MGSSGWFHGGSGHIPQIFRPVSKYLFGTYCVPVPAHKMPVPAHTYHGSQWPGQPLHRGSLGSASRTLGLFCVRCRCEPWDTGDTGNGSGSSSPEGLRDAAGPWRWPVGFLEEEAALSCSEESRWLSPAGPARGGWEQPGMQPPQSGEQQFQEGLVEGKAPCSPGTGPARALNTPCGPE